MAWGFVVCSGATMNRAGKELLSVRPVMQSRDIGWGFRVGWRTVGNLISIFKKFSSSIGGAFILAGDWALRYHSMGFGH